MLLLKMVDSLFQIVIEKLDKNYFQMWKFIIMNFLMGKGYYKKPPFPKNPYKNKFKATKLAMKKF